MLQLATKNYYKKFTEDSELGLSVSFDLSYAKSSYK